jgi:1-acyl-sn-glycerol-3-phosphate acyltransferase
LIFLRSIAFNLFFYGWLFSLSLVCLPLLALPRAAARRVVRLGVHGVVLFLRVLVGLDYRVTGREHIPAEGPVVLAAKHQSAWDTMIFLILFDDPIYVLKHELFDLPLYGWYARRLGMIGVDRSAGAPALKGMVAKARPTLAAGHPIIIFPQGTRTPPCSRLPYLPGVYALAVGTGATVVPVALDSGRFWPRRKFARQPGCITIAFLPPMPKGLDRKRFMAELEERVESASDALCGCGQTEGEQRG